EVFADQECKVPLEFQGNKAPVKSLESGKPVAAWVRPKDDKPFSLTLTAEAKGKSTLSSNLDFKRAFTFLDGTSRWLQLVDSFESVAEIKSNINRIRSLAALADMATVEFANFAIKRLFIRK